MRQFRNFPIYIIFSLHRQLAVEPIWKQSYVDARLARQEAIRQLGKLNFGKMVKFLEIARQKDDLISQAIQWQLVDDLSPKYKKEIADYENAVDRLLTTISHTSIGAKLLSMINQKTEIFIIPQMEVGPARTIQMDAAEGGGTRIYFSPAQWQNLSFSLNGIVDSREETLLHELVHAMRGSNDSLSYKNFYHAEFRKDAEEFIAAQFENIYHAARRASDTYSGYYGIRRKKNDMYEYFTEQPDLFLALAFFMQHEPLARFAAILIQPDYNPFRDFKRIEKKFLERYNIDKYVN